MELYIGLVKSSTKARQRYHESIAVNLVFQQAVRMCETMSGVPIQLVGKRSLYRKDGRSIASDTGRYQGFHFASPYSRKTLSELEESFFRPVRSLLARFCETNLAIYIYRREEHQFLEENKLIGTWDRLFVLTIE